MMNIRTAQMIDVSDWDYLVIGTYAKPYSFQQQDGCKERGIFEFQVPDEGYDYENDSLPYVINGEERGVGFNTWLETPAQKYEDIFWERNFYPDVSMIANGLHGKGLLPAGSYIINIDW